MKNVLIYFIILILNRQQNYDIFRIRTVNSNNLRFFLKHLIKSLLSLKKNQEIDVSKIKNFNSTIIEKEVKSLKLYIFLSFHSLGNLIYKSFLKRIQPIPLQFYSIIDNEPFEIIFQPKKQKENDRTKKISKFFYSYSFIQSNNYVSKTEFIS